MDLGADLSEMGNYEESQEFMQVLKDLVRLEKMANEASSLSSDFMKRLRSNDEGCRDYLNYVREQLEEAKEMAIKWKNVEEIMEYNELTWECGPGYKNRQAYPTIEEEEEEDEGLVMQTRDSLICPISQGLLKDPVRNVTCNHSYSKAMIEGLFNSRTHTTISCPVPGCRGTVTRGNLVVDEKLEKKLKRVSKRIFIK